MPASIGTGRVRLVVEVVIVALLAVQIVRLGLILAEAPPSPSGAGANTEMTAPDPAILQSFDAFFRDGADDQLTKAEAGAPMLFGVRVGGQDGGSAILGLSDGTQVFASVGEQIDGDAVLESVAYDHVVLVRGGARTRLTFERPADIPVEGEAVATDAALAGPIGGRNGARAPQIATARAPGSTSAAPAASATDPAAAMAGATFRPRMRGLGINGFTVGASGDGDALRAIGLQPGDVIVAVNGTELNSLGRIARLKTDLKSAASAEIRYERGGETRTLTLGAPR